MVFMRNAPHVPGDTERRLLAELPPDLAPWRGLVPAILPRRPIPHKLP